MCGYVPSDSPGFRELGEGTHFKVDYRVIIGNEIAKDFSISLSVGCFPLIKWGDIA